ncbi:peroxiredoxin-4-like isoform X3 [Macrosteles quadrilineatus]|uniref:peroxiredoxin-4-like isoform X3 n=1 Tax=Macrosteles quadrilineatus TaxID=74068 RepID=UPI0023E1C930|nr:peroxiredoxin-4-like isoform X3 [Macrosteles quadrilineatus]XP_054261677.1 peroxiredoxin-4-like isoform X3 [Macrosteles quadrilineatus]
MAEHVGVNDVDSDLLVLKSANSVSQDDTGNESSTQSIATPPKKRKSRKQQKYRKAWEHFPEFSFWLEEVENNCYKARCKVCSKVLVADISVLQSHSQAIKHLNNSEEFRQGIKTLEALSGVGSGRSSDPPSRSLFQRKSANEEQKAKEVAEDIDFDCLSISDHLQEQLSAEGNYTEHSEGQQLSAMSGRRPVAEPPSYTSKAIVTKPAPPWKATAIVNGHVTRLELNDYKGRYLILFFYPQDFSAVCPTELLSLSDRVLEFRAVQTEIVACSVDSHLTHLAWARTPRNEGGLGNPKIPLLADPTHSIARDYGVLLPDLGHTLRAHFIIDRRGILRHMLVNDLGVGRNIDELLRITRALQYVDETETGCPADWKPGLPGV